MLDKEIFTVTASVAVGILGLSVAVSPLMSLMDRISFVVSTLSPEPIGFQAIKAYWYLARNPDVLNKAMEKLKKGESVFLILPVGEKEDDHDHGEWVADKKFSK